MARIIAPNKDYSGVSAGVTFTKGAGETKDKRLIAWFKAHGYEVEEQTVAAKSISKKDKQVAESQPAVSHEESKEGSEESEDKGESEAEPKEGE